MSRSWSWSFTRGASRDRLIASGPVYEGDKQHHSSSQNVKTSSGTPVMIVCNIAWNIVQRIKSRTRNTHPKQLKTRSPNSLVQSTRTEQNRKLGQKLSTNPSTTACAYGSSALRCIDIAVSRPLLKFSRCLNYGLDSIFTKFFHPFFKFASFPLPLPPPPPAPVLRPVPVNVYARSRLLRARFCSSAMSEFSLALGRCLLRATPALDYVPPMANASSRGATHPSESEGSGAPPLHRHRLHTHIIVSVFPSYSRTLTMSPKRLELRPTYLLVSTGERGVGGVVWVLSPRGRGGPLTAISKPFIVREPLRDT